MNQESEFEYSEFEYLVIGAGPAGVQLGYFLEQAKHHYLILEAGATPGTFFRTFPRHQQLISINKVHTGYVDPEVNLRWDWNSLLSHDETMLFKHYSRDYFPRTDALVQYLADFVDRFQLNIKYNCPIVKIAKDGDRFLVIDHNGNVYSSRCLIMATGVSQPYVPNIPGIELAENYTEVSVNPEDFANQRVLIIGKGNSGFETADNLVATASLIHIASPRPLSLAWKTKYVGHLRAVNNNFLDTYQLKSQNAVIDANIRQIKRLGEQYCASFSYSHAKGEQEEMLYDRIIVCTGFRFDSSIFDASCQPELTINDRFPAQTSEWESTNVKNLYFVGVLMHMRDFKKKQSGFIHGFRYNVQALHHLLEAKYHGHPIPARTLPATATHLTEAILSRVNRSSGLWQQTGFLCDLIVVAKDSSSVHYYKELPADYIFDSQFGQAPHYYTISLEFGKAIEEMPDPFAIDRVHKDDVEHAAQSLFLHPIIRRYAGQELVAEHHVIEDLEAEWVEEIHIRPLQAFLSEQLAKAVSFV